MSPIPINPNSESRMHLVRRRPATPGRRDSESMSGSQSRSGGAANPAFLILLLMAGALSWATVYAWREAALAIAVPSSAYELNARQR